MHQIIDDMRHTIIKLIIIGHLTKQPPHEWRRFWDKFLCFMTREGLQCRIMQSGCKQSIRDSLSVHIRKLIWRQVRNQHIFKSAILTVESRLVAVLSEDVLDGVFDQLSFLCHRTSELFWRSYCLSAIGQEVDEESLELDDIVRKQI